jgi:RND family efflux transporter MFP subunit
MMLSVSKRIWMPLAVLAFGGIATVGLVAATPSLDTRKPQHKSPAVRVVRAEPRPVKLVVRTQGSVTPRTESELVAEVSGRIIAVSPSLASGGFLEPGEILVHIDPSDYEIALERARAALSRAESQVGLARTALERQESLAQRSVGSSKELDAARSAGQVAEADLRDARAAVTQAERDLERTRVRVPYAGRVRQKKVDVGQYVNRGTPIARVYAVDYAEVRLPIPDREAAYLDLPIDYRGDAGESRGPSVLLRARYAGRDHTWTGHIVRTEGELDPRTRMIHAVARVEDPYARSEDVDRPPLAVGLFVEAEIEGRERGDIVVLPRESLRGADQVAIVGDDGRLELRRVEVLRRDRDRVLVSAGIRAGERVTAGPLAVAVDGMRVRAMEAPRGAVEALARARTEEREAVSASVEAASDRETGRAGAETLAALREEP